VTQSAASVGDPSEGKSRECMQYVLKILSRMCVPLSLLGRMNNALVSLEPTLETVFVQIVI
jgi:hypothetical protein